jgi:transcription elongation factor GreA
MENKRPISRAGFDALAKELKQLKEIELPEIHRAVQAARELGDLSENAEYSAAREAQRNTNKRIGYLESVIGNAQVIDVSSLSGDRIVFGAHVLVEDENGKQMQCQILSDIEADGKTIVACTSPFGRALIGKCTGDTCVVRTPSGDKEYDILNVEFK